MTGRAVAVGQTLGVVFAAALGGVLAKQTLAEVSPLTFSWLHLAIGGAMITFYTFGVRRERIPTLGARSWLLLVAIGVCHFTIVRVAGYLALERLTATTYAFVIQFTGVVTMVLSAVMLREPPSALQVLGALLALVGLYVFFPETPAPEESTGLIYMAIAVVVLALVNVLMRLLNTTAATTIPNSVVTTLTVWFGFPLVLVAGLWQDGAPAVPGSSNWLIIAFVGFVGVALGMTVWNHILRTLRAYEASVLATAGVIFTAVLAIPILGESLEVYQIAGITLMVAGLSLAQLRRSLRRGPPR